MVTQSLNSANDRSWLGFEFCSKCLHVLLKWDNFFTGNFRQSGASGIRWDTRGARGDKLVS